jgi:serralysin
MAWQIPQSVTQAATVADLTTTDDVFVANGVTIASTAAATIAGTGSDHEARIYGTVVGRITLGDDAFADSGEKVTIKQGGQVHFFGPGSAIICTGVITKITNEGLIASDEFGIALNGVTVGATTSTINNSGTIETVFGAVSRQVGSNETIALNNSGLIHGGTTAYSAAGALGADLITNTGRMIGVINLASGNDVYNGALGHLSGNVLGGDGNDVIVCGKDNDALFGNADNDTLTGGLGKDTCTGGTGRDIFDFNSIGESVVGANRDFIADFTHGTNITGDDIDLSTIDAKTSVSGNQTLSWKATQPFHHIAGELRYTDLGASALVQGDVNGDAKADFEILVKVANGVLGPTDFFL